MFAAGCGSSKKSDTSSTTVPGGTGTTAAGGTPTTAAQAKLADLPGKTGGTVTYAAEQEFTAYNNASSDNGLVANTLVLNDVQPGPFVVDGKLSFVLNTDMMDSVTVKSENPQVVEYKVKPTAVWEDGNPIDCDDFYLAWLSQNGVAVSDKDEDADGKKDGLFKAASTTGYDQISKVECADSDHTITTTYDSQFADYKGLFGNLMPAHILESKTGVADVTKVAAVKDTPGTGDILKVAQFWNEGWNDFDASVDLSGAWYRISAFEKGVSLTLERNPKYYGKPGYLDKIIYKQVPDAAQQPAALGNGDVQVISPQPNADLLASLASISGVKSQTNFGTTFEHIDFNFKNPILADKAVRTAIAQCVDRNEIVEKLIKPSAPNAEVLGNRILLANQAGYKDNGGAFAKADPEKAKATLTAAGWTLGGDGIMTKGGQRLSLKVGRRDPNPRRQQQAELFAAQCKPAGIELVDAPNPDFNSKLLPAGQYDIPVRLAGDAHAVLQHVDLRRGWRPELPGPERCGADRHVQAAQHDLRRHQAGRHREPDRQGAVGSDGNAAAVPVPRPDRVQGLRVERRLQRRPRRHVERLPVVGRLTAPD